MKTYFLFLAAFLASSVIFPTTAIAEWDPTGNPICTAYGDQDEARVMEDGAGNIIVLWTDTRMGDYDVYVQKIDPFGNMLWTADGVLVCNEYNTQSKPKMTTDGAGGAIICWQDYRNMTDYDIYAQRIRSNGSLDWGSTGVAVCTKESNQTDPSIASDGEGGAIIAWTDSRAGNEDIYAQRINGNGAPQWTSNGEPVCSDASIQVQPLICESSYGGTIVSWIDSRNGNLDIFVQRLNSSGYTSWTSGGVAVCIAAEHQFVREIVPDEIGGCIIVWEDFRSLYSDIYAQRVYSSGNCAWTTNGIGVCTASYDQYSINMVPDGDGGAAIVWQDERGSGVSIYAQRVDRYGTAYWTADGVGVCTNYYSQAYPDIVLSEDGGFIFTWYDARRGMNDVYAQKLDGTGNIIWPADDVLVSDIPNFVKAPAIASDGMGGAVIVYTYLTGAYDLRAQRIERNSYWGYPGPVISDVRDVPGDQGGSVDLAWYASRLDPWPSAMISHYTLWRAISHPAAALDAAGATRFITDASELPSSPEGEYIRYEVTGAAEYYWSLVATVPAYYLSSYSETLPTLFDSTDASNEYHYFQVIAHTEDPVTFWISPPDSGYSVDNLAPAAPLGLAGEQTFSPEGLQLTWDPNSEPDLAAYKIYRGTSSGFVPGPGSFITSTPDTMTLDEGWDWEAGYWYKVSAVDIHGNESIFAVLSPESVTGDDPRPVPDAAFLSHNWPNPFNPATTIRFGLAEPAHVTLRIYDTAGRLVRTLLDEHREAKIYEVSWDGRDNQGIPAASGIYFCRIAADAFIDTKKMTLLR